MSGLGGNVNLKWPRCDGVNWPHPARGRLAC